MFKPFSTISPRYPSPLRTSSSQFRCVLASERYRAHPCELSHASCPRAAHVALSSTQTFRPLIRAQITIQCHPMLSPPDQSPPAHAQLKQINSSYANLLPHVQYSTVTVAFPFRAKVILWNFTFITRRVPSIVTIFLNSIHSLYPRQCVSPCPTHHSPSSSSGSYQPSRLYPHPQATAIRHSNTASKGVVSPIAIHLNRPYPLI